MSNDGIERIRIWLAATNRNQFEGAKRLGITQPTLSRILSGKVQPTLATIQQVAPALGVSALDLAIDFDVIGLTDEPLLQIRERLKRLSAADQITLTATFAVLIDVLEGEKVEGESEQPTLTVAA